MKALTQYIVVGALALLAAVAVTRGDLGLAGLGWAHAAAEAAGSIVPQTQTATHASQAAAP